MKRNPVTSSSYIDQNAYLRDWINTTSYEEEPEFLSNGTQNVEADECLTARFYACCLRVLQKILQQLSAIGTVELEKKALDTQVRMLHEELGRLYLCGDGFANGEIGQALDHAQDLRNNILEILCGIGSLLTRGRCRYIQGFGLYK